MGHLPCDSERFPAARQNSHLRTAVQDGIDQMRRSVQQMLAIVQYKQGLLVFKCRAKCLCDWLTCCVMDVQRLRNRLRHQRRIGGGGKLEGRPGRLICHTCSGAARSFRRCIPRSLSAESDGSELRTNSAVTRLSSVCCPCAALCSLAVRLSAGPK